MKKPDKPTRKLAIDAMCHECLGYYSDGKLDCENVKCPLYPYHPQRKLKPDLTWLDYNPRRKGSVTWEECEVEISDEERKRRSELGKSRSICKELGL